MPIDLKNPLSWKNADPDELTLLSELQANILKAHVRDHLEAIFLKFTDVVDAKNFLSGMTNLMKSALDHLSEVENYKNNSVPGSAYVGLGLSRMGYDFLGILIAPTDAAFVRGMSGTTELNDPDVLTWDKHFQVREELHAVVIVGDKSEGTMKAMNSAVQVLLDGMPSIVVVGRQPGVAQISKTGLGLEQFGYVDGISQPLFLTEDIAKESAQRWKPGSPLKQVIVSDLSAPDPSLHYGSYFVFRKLEQNVRMFKQLEVDKGVALGLQGKDADRAGAMLVGRFEDGTPVAEEQKAQAINPPPNDFTYSADPAGARCPFVGHIRKTNPRGSGGFGQSVEAEHAHLMARRGLTYGIRVDDLNDDDIENKPVGDVGLLFMAFNSDLEKQFEFTQISWANNPSFPEVTTGRQPGLDPIIGQAAPSNLATVWDSKNSFKAVAVTPQVVTMKGGEYFFMPSLAFLKAL